jgi:hypothetical protein
MRPEATFVTSLFELQSPVPATGKTLRCHHNSHALDQQWRDLVRSVSMENKQPPRQQCHAHPKEIVSLSSNADTNKSDSKRMTRTDNTRDAQAEPGYGLHAGARSTGGRRMDIESGRARYLEGAGEVPPPRCARCCSGPPPPLRLCSPPPPQSTVRPLRPPVCCRTVSTLLPRCKASMPHDNEVLARGGGLDQIILHWI